MTQLSRIEIQFDSVKESGSWNVLIPKTSCSIGMLNCVQTAQMRYRNIWANNVGLSLFRSLCFELTKLAVLGSRRASGERGIRGHTPAADTAQSISIPQANRKRMLRPARAWSRDCSDTQRLASIRTDSGGHAKGSLRRGCRSAVFSYGVPRLIRKAVVGRARHLSATFVTPSQSGPDRFFAKLCGR
jgi:hypothetical protein